MPLNLIKWATTTTNNAQFYRCCLCVCGKLINLFNKRAVYTVMFFAAAAAHLHALMFSSGSCGYCFCSYCCCCCSSSYCCCCCCCRTLDFIWMLKHFLCLACLAWSGTWNAHSLSRPLFLYAALSTYLSLSPPLSLLQFTSVFAQMSFCHGRNSSASIDIRLRLREHFECPLPSWI